ncbi:sensor domain-containing diguanylate cyclase [Vibrio coralliilyticus]|uniref:sensor domain-containing diguanylate cyclase n=1 Tax=Vibrio coralliilyticus TaxID=190893 RepID=UPI001561908F|nr:sensor domain-containing diguanylate cyclase [Vibrio coralliilyticus]NRF64458.1 sensor domain-containing diguanylate cyclase [Vibrio coralliilyticus]
MVDTQQCLTDPDAQLIDLSKWQEMVNLLADLFGAATGAIVQLRNDEFNVVVSSQNPDHYLEAQMNWPWNMKSFCRHMVETRQDLYVPSAATHEVWSAVPPVAEGAVRSYCGIPIFWPNGKPFGSICVIDTNATSYDKTLIRVLCQLARLVTLDLDTACRLQEAEELALKDDLTNTFNRRGLTLLGEQKIKDAPRYQQAIGMLYIDIDNLKQVNDKGGHESGDQCILILAQTLREACRQSDVIARLGGDEFVVLSLLNTRRELKQLAARVSAEYLAQTKDKESLSLTSLSIGSHIEDCFGAPCLEDLIAQSDKAMYQNKQSKK